MKKCHPEYLRRNELVAKSFGVTSGVEAIERRLTTMKRKPKWLINSIAEIKSRAVSVRAEMVVHRDERISDRDEIVKPKR